MRSCVLVIGLICLLVCCGCDKDSSLKLESTGDPLFDRYASALLDTYGRDNFTVNVYTEPYPLNLPYATIIAWESEFETDPRFWELLWLRARDQEEHYSDLSSTEPVRSYREFLQYLITSKPTTQELVAQSWELNSEAWYREFSQDEEMLDMEQEGSLSMAREREAVLDHGDEMLECVSLIIEADRDNSIGYYRRAIIFYAMGDLQNALVDLKAGNNAPNNRALLPFPYSKAIDCYASGTVAGHPAIHGVLAAYSIHTLIDPGDFLRPISLELTPDNDHIPEGFADAWFKFLCRYGSMDRADPLYRAIAAGSILKITNNWLESDALELTDREHEELQELKQLLVDYRERLKQKNELQSQFEDKAGDLSDVLIPEGGICNSDSFAYLMDYFQFDYQNQPEMNRPFQECSQFNFDTLSFAVMGESD